MTAAPPIPSLLVAALLCACTPPVDPGWRVVLDEQPGALLSVTGTGSDDIWIVGADQRDGTGPTILHFDGTRFESHHTGDEGDLWWVQLSPSGTLWTAGEGGRVFRRAQGGSFEPVHTPEPIRLFGVLPFADDDVWAVGGDELTGQAVVWRYDGTSWALPDGLDPDVLDRRVVFKIWGTSSNDVWLVGDGGGVLHYADGAWESIAVPANARLITVSGVGEDIVAVGGFYEGAIMTLAPGLCTEVTPAGLRQMSGVHVATDGTAIAAGNDGAIWRRSAAGEWTQDEDAPPLDLDYHAVFRDPDGGVWAVGGLLAGFPLERGLLTHMGGAVPAEVVIE